MKNISCIFRQVIRFAIFSATLLVGSTYFFVGSAIAGAGDNKKIEVVKPEVAKVEVVKPDKPEAVKVKAASDSRVFVRNVRNPFVRNFIDADGIFFGD
jgi:hypothetical protein